MTITRIRSKTLSHRVITKKKKKRCEKRFSLSAKIIIVCVRGFKAFCEMKEQSATIGSPVRYFYIVSQLVTTSTCGIVSRWPTCQVGPDDEQHRYASSPMCFFFFFHAETRVESEPWSNNAVLLYLRFFLTSLNPYLSPTRSVLIFSFCRKLFESWLKSRLWSFISRLI